MAKGRFITSDITKDKKINDLSDDTSRLGFTWLVTFADREGRTFGDPALVRSMLFPRRDDISLEQMEAYLQEWHDAGLICWYEAKGDKWIEFPNFDKHQKLRKDREAPSNIPEPGWSNSGPTPEQDRVKLKDIKLEEGIPPLPQTPKEAQEHPYIKPYINVCGKTPGERDYKMIIDSVELLVNRWNSKFTEMAEPYWLAWKARGYGLTNPAWLEWAINEHIPPKTKKEPIPNTEGWTRA